MSVRKRTWLNKDGTTSIRYIYDYIQNGKRKRISFDHKPTIKELAQLEDTVSNNPYFKHAIKDYLKNHCRLHCKTSTIETYENYASNALTPLYIYKVKDFKRQHGERYIVNLLENYAPKTVNNILTFLKSFLNYMVDIKVIAENPVKKIKPIPLKRDLVKALTYEQMECFKKHAKTKPFWVYVFFMVILNQGLRISECIALEWADIDFENMTMNINKQFYRYRITPTKNYETRIIEIPLTLLKLLQKLYQTSTSNLIFNSPLTNGKHINVNNMRERHFIDILRDVEEELNVDLDGITPHCLRHTHATYLLQNGIPVIAVSRRLGHRDCKTTLNIYNHCMASDNEKIIKLLDGTKNGTKKRKSQARQGRDVRVV